MYTSALDLRRSLYAVSCASLFIYRPCPNCKTSCELAVLQWLPRAHVRKVHETVGCPIPHFNVQKGARDLLLLSPHWDELRSGLLPDSQSSITSRKCGLRGRLRGFRVPFGTGPIVLHRRPHQRAVHMRTASMQCPQACCLCNPQYYGQAEKEVAHLRSIIAMMAANKY